MEKIIEWSDEQKKAWEEWVASRPPVIQEMCRRFPPDRLYRLKTSNHRVTLYSYSENGTLTVKVNGKYNAVMFDRQVFGIKPDDLEECDLPGNDEITGTVFTQEEEVEAFIDIIRNGIACHKEKAHDEF